MEKDIQLKSYLCAVERLHKRLFPSQMQTQLKPKNFATLEHKMPLDYTAESNTKLNKNCISSKTLINQLN